MIRQALARPVSTLLGALTVVVLGVFSLLRLPVSLLPALERPGLEITASAPGSSREEMLERVTRPLEQRLGAIPGVHSVRSSSWVTTLAPPAPVLASTPSTGPISWSWKPAEKMSQAL